MGRSSGLLFGGLLLLGVAGYAGPAAGSKAKSDRKANPERDQGEQAQGPGQGQEENGSDGGERFKPIAGPSKVEAGHDIVIDLPEGYLFLDAPQAKKLMEKMGNLWNDNLLGVLSQDESSWFVTVRYTEEGYVKDDEAEKMDADEILNAIKEGTEEANKERQQRGFAAMEIRGWSEPPTYQRSAHHLVWGIKAHGAGDDDDVINFNTRILGRRGYVALNLIDGAKTIEASKPSAAKLLAATTFKPGARYEDFDAKSDKVAEYGLAALVLGGAGVGALKLVKVGLLAKFGAKLLALLLALKKGIILVILAAVAALKRFLGFGKKKEAVAAAPAAPEAGPAPSVVQQHPTEGVPGGERGA